MGSLILEYTILRSFLNCVKSLESLHVLVLIAPAVNIEKISICLNRGREESVGNDDVSIVCARKYEMVRMT